MSWWGHFTFTTQHTLCSSRLTERRQVSKGVQRLLWKIPVSPLCCAVSPGHFPFSCAFLKRRHQRKQIVPAAFLRRARGCELEVSSVTVWCRSWHFNAGCSCLGKIEELGPNNGCSPEWGPVINTPDALARFPKSEPMEQCEGWPHFLWRVWNKSYK